MGRTARARCLSAPRRQHPLLLPLLGQLLAPTIEFRLEPSARRAVWERGAEQVPEDAQRSWITCVAYAGLPVRGSRGIIARCVSWEVPFGRIAAALSFSRIHSGTSKRHTTCPFKNERTRKRSRLAVSHPRPARKTPGTALTRGAGWMFRNHSESLGPVQEGPTASPQSSQQHAPQQGPDSQHVHVQPGQSQAVSDFMLTSAMRNP